MKNTPPGADDIPEGSRGNNPPPGYVPAPEKKSTAWRTALIAVAVIVLLVITKSCSG